MIRSSQLSLLLVALVAFVIGLSSDRVYSELRVENGVVFNAGAGGNELLGLLKEGGGVQETLRDQKMEEMVRRHGQAFFDKSVSYSGTNHRLRRVLRRALNGESIRIGVLGGSITAGNNTPSGMGRMNTYHALFWKWWQEIFPDAVHEYHPVGIGAFGSAYFANCFLEHLPAELDLIIIDFAVNDERDDEYFRSFDHLLRSLLTLPTAPAVISMEFFVLGAYNILTGGGGNQLDSSRYLDVPSLSLRNPLLPELLLHPQRIPDFYGRLPISMGGIVDGRHPGLLGHLLAGEIVKNYVWKQIQYVEAHNSEEDRERESLAVSKVGQVDEEKEGVYDPKRIHTQEEHEFWQEDRSHVDVEDWGSRPEDLEVVSRMALLDRFNPSSFIPLSVPQCRSISGTREKLVLLSTTKGDKIENGTTYPGEGDGWFEWQSSPEKQYIITRSPNAQVTFSVTVGLGDVKLWYLKSFEFGLGDVICWVDEDWNMRVRLKGYWDTRANIGKIGTVREGLAPGDHLLHCKKEGTGEFRISSLITG
ncbi:hypothetical protein BDY24DRAFT_379878 [Mrakia frigida]|uniref:SGNH/GDSL hydrolase family protein n=1 Tax=Mrakia frigida TaxID=29902 RepID=UPI003FCBEFB5